MWLLTRVWESRRYLLPVGCFRGGSHGLFQKVLLTLSPGFSPYACDKSHSPGVHVLVDTVAAIKSFCFSLEQNVVINRLMKTAILLDIPFLIASVQQPFQRNKSPQLSWIPRNLRNTGQYLRRCWF